MTASNGSRVHNWLLPWGCGFGSGITDIVVTFPINKIMFRQQLNGYTARYAVQSLRSEMKGMRFPKNLVYLYRGVLPPTFNRCMGRMFTFGGYDNFMELYKRKTALTGFSCKMGAAVTSGVVEAFICCPLERFQTILQDDKSNRRFANTFQLVRDLGFREWYRGIRPILLRNGPATFIYFSIYEQSLQVTRNEFFRGAMGGICATCYGYIFNVVKARQQAIISVPESEKYKSNLFTLRQIYNERERSVFQLFRGFRFALLRTSLSWGITTYFYKTCYEYFTNIEKR